MFQQLQPAKICTDSSMAAPTGGENLKKCAPFPRGLSIASFHFSQHPSAEQITPSENLLSNQTCCLSGLFMLCSQNQLKNDARHLCRCICTLFSGSLFLNHKQTFKPCVPKKDIIKSCTQKKHGSSPNSFNSTGFLRPMP